MPLPAGTRIGSYEVSGAIGAGGMGEVYKARDTKLGRDVALKVLPPAFALAPDRVARFRREAQVLAALNHPNVASIYGFEEPSTSSGQTASSALVMELVDGPTLADRLAQGALPLEETLPIARQIVAAMEAAHAQGIIHRDLKPANVKVRSDGTVKVLDFGLAKALDPGQDSQGSGLKAQANLSNSPTITSPAMTELGMILGTAAYMSPEQAKGRAVDQRADIWAFGCMLFEMLTGQRAFGGDDVSDTLASILKSAPDWSALPATTPRSLRRLIRRCLAKDLAARLPDIRVARLEIDDAMSPDVDADTPSPSSATSARTTSWWPWAALAVTAAALLAALPIVFSHLRETPAPASTVRFSVPPPSGHAFRSPAAFAAVSPDGQHVLYCAMPTNPPTRLWLYSLATQDARELPGTERACGGFWSPDSRSIAFVLDGRLKRLTVPGGSVQTLAEVNAIVGGSWNRDGIIIIGSNKSGLRRVSAAGGAVVPLTTLDTAKNEAAHVLPQFLPDGRRFLFTVVPGNVVKLGSLDSSVPSEVLKVGTHAWYASPGYLLFARQGTLVAQRFDLSSATVSGDPVPIAEGVRMFAGNWGLFSASENGALVYESGDTAAGGTPIWVDRKGQSTPVVPEGLDDAQYPRLSPDGRRLAVIRAGDLWVQDLTGRPPIRLTFDGKERPHFSPLWTPDGQRIVYETQSPSRLGVLPSDASSATPTMLGPDGHFHPYGWSAGGRELVAARLGPDDIVALSMAGETARDVVVTPAEEGPAGLSLSPDGRWLAYSANPTGQTEIWVRPYPGPGAPVRVSPSGGVEPVWARNGRELFYVDLPKGQLMAVSIQVEPELRFSTPVALFSVREFRFSQPPTYDVAADGRFLMIRQAGNVAPGTRPLTVVLNWAEELRRAAEGR
jgi:serine/threonine protein kinase/dipeptidyl aminopeptidase/acylaminoacyl peptidase